MEGAGANVPLRLPLLSGVDYPVGLVEVLGATCEDMGLGALVVVEAGDVGSMGIDLGVPLGHPLSEGATRSRPLLDPNRRTTPQVADVGLTDQRHGVGGERKQPVDPVAHLGLGQHRHQLDRLFQLGVEVVLGQRQLGG